MRKKQYNTLMEQQVFYVRNRTGAVGTSFHLTLENGKNLTANLQRHFFLFWRMPDFSQKTSISLCENLFFFWRWPEKKFGDVFCFENTCALCPWPQKGLPSRSRSLALEFFVSLASKVVSSTPPLLNKYRIVVRFEALKKHFDFLTQGPSLF